MLQRIQSVYLFFVFALMVSTLLLPLLSFTDGTILYSYGFIEGTLNKSTPYGIVCLGGLSGLIALIELFLYKNRKMQMSLGIINALLIIFLYITIAVYTSTGMNSMNLEFSKIGIGIIFPVIAFIFNILAYFKIKQDDKLVKSLDRIR